MFAKARFNLLLFLFLPIAFWPVIRWYLLRVMDHSDEPWGVLALATLCLFFVIKRKKRVLAIPNFILPSIFLAIYILLFNFTPPLLRAFIAIITTSSILSQLFFGKFFNPSVYTLSILSLPIISSLQYYGGYPLRVITGFFMVPLLRLSGFNVVMDGVLLNFAGKTVLIDAPCSGIKMIWTGLYLSSIMALFFKLSSRNAMILLVLSLVFVLAGNILRSTSLFFLEAKVIQAPHWMHNTAGISAFLISSLVIAASAYKLRSRPI